MTAEKQKTAVGKLLQGKFIKNILAPVVRGLVKQVPILGTPLVEVISNITQPKTEVTVDGTGSSVEVIKPLKHSYVSIATQIVCASAIVWAFYTHQISVQDVIALVKQVAGL